MLHFDWKIKWCALSLKKYAGVYAKILSAHAAKNNAKRAIYIAKMYSGLLKKKEGICHKVLLENFSKSSHIFLPHFHYIVYTLHTHVSFKELLSCNRIFLSEPKEKFVLELKVEKPLGFFLMQKP